MYCSKITQPDLFSFLFLFFLRHIPGNYAMLGIEPELDTCKANPAPQILYFKAMFYYSFWNCCGGYNLWYSRDWAVPSSVCGIKTAQSKFHRRNQFWALYCLMEIVVAGVGAIYTFGIFVCLFWELRSSLVGFGE